jgi:glycosyltransferase involved in cell wall biosynthesis
MQKLSIAIPVYNSEKTISPLVEKLINEITEYTLEIVLVNDKSKDNSEKICVDIYNRYPKIVKFFSLAKNVGEHNAVMAALNNVSGDYTIIIDDDFQNPVAEVIRLAKFSFENKFDVVYTY